MDHNLRAPLVLVTGAGRSGTSSLAGSLKRLGMHIPLPELEADERNPRGYYEPRWVIRFHKAYLKRLGFHNIDSRPSATAMVAELVETGEPARRLTEWLADQPRERALLIKDPHAFWFAEAWKTSCAASDLSLRWLTAVRHPAEVVGSRDLAYLQNRSDDLRLTKETSNVAGWVHAAMLTELAGRGGARAFVRYDDLLDDWRIALRRVSDQLDLELDIPEAGRPHPVDDFVEPSLRRSHVSWEGISVPVWLREMAEEVWSILGDLVGEPASRAGSQRLDALHEEYQERYAEAIALTFDHTEGEHRLAIAAERETIQTLRRRVEKLRDQVNAKP